ncbi:hypothetical protein EVB41_069 [Rhizobium phage RHph_TM3_14A]|nr:hypothetical protein EVB29_069 [Rhizobium phage RHph_TM27A]QIG66989.1 hypothetical protein EVB30_069 [Rhizobium phage RHph_TM27B]QIG67078.1 hypothetical protein EVB31_068 [Rhizobium phage RHph_TM29]QIG67534.1 hypothetical protein EVB41_069 [Rhizobium phage RHph_TM3_14A]
MIPIERYLERQVKGLKITASKRKDKALAMQCEYRGKKFVVGFKSPCSALQMIEEIRKHDRR